MENKKIKSIRRTIVFAITVFLVSACTDPIEKVKQGKPCVGCDLRNADLAGVSLSGVDLSGADLSGANLTGAIVDSDTNFNNVNLSGANLTNVDAYDTDFHGVDFSGATVKNFRVRESAVSNITFPEFKKPQEVLSNVGRILKRIEMSDVADEMLFDVDRGMTFDILGKANLVDVADIFDIERLLFADLKSGNKEIYWSEELYQQKVDAFGDVYIPRRSMRIKFGEGISDDQRKKYSAQFGDEGDLDLFLLLVDHVEQWPNGRNTGYRDLKTFTSLEKYLYELYENQIEISGIRECTVATIDLQSDFDELVREDLDNTGHHLLIEIARQSLPQFQMEVENYNTCANTAYENFYAGVQTFKETFMRILIEVHREDYLAQLEEDSEKKKSEEDRRNYTEKLSSLTRQLYDADDLIPEMIKVEGLLSLQPKAMEIAQTGVDAKIWLENRMKQKSAAFERSMNRCVMFDFYGEFDEKKRSKNIQKFQSAVNDRNSDKDLNARINACRYDANRAFLSG